MMKLLLLQHLHLCQRLRQHRHQHRHQRQHRQRHRQRHQVLPPMSQDVVIEIARAIRHGQHRRRHLWQHRRQHRRQHQYQVLLPISEDGVTATEAAQATKDRPTISVLSAQRVVVVQPAPGAPTAPLIEEKSKSLPNAAPKAAW